MTDAALEKSSIIIPHFETPGHLDFCLRCLARFTDEPHETIVVDNGSSAETLARLREREGIVLLERQQDPALDQEAHKAALDLGIDRADGAYVVAIHCDTFVFRKGWLSFLIDRLESDGLVACGPASHRLYPPSLSERIRSLGKGRQEEEGGIRPVFTIYRAGLFASKRFMDFPDVGGVTEEDVEAGRATFLDRAEASRWVFHPGGTTRLHHLGHRKKAKRKKEKLYRTFLSRPAIRELTREGGMPSF